MENEPFGPEWENTPEAKQNKKLFSDYANLALVYGEKNNQPLDPALEAGNDGTLDMFGEPIEKSSLLFEDNEVPEGLKQKNINRFEIKHIPNHRLDDKMADESVSILWRENLGESEYLQKNIILSEDIVGRIEAWSDVSASWDRESGALLNTEIDNESFNRVLEAIAEGEDLSELDESEQAQAEMLLMRMSEFLPQESLEQHDANLLEDAYREIENKLKSE